MIDDKIMKIFESINKGVEEQDICVLNDIHDMKQTCYHMYTLLCHAATLKDLLDKGEVVKVADLQQYIEIDKDALKNEKGFEEYWRLVQYLLGVKVETK